MPVEKCAGTELSAVQRGTQQQQAVRSSSKQASKQCDLPRTFSTPSHNEWIPMLQSERELYNICLHCAAVIVFDIVFVIDNVIVIVIFIFIVQRLTALHCAVVIVLFSTRQDPTQTSAAVYCFLRRRYFISIFDSST